MKKQTYSLYDTYLDEDDITLSSKEKKELAKRLSDLDQTHSKAVILLICEHAIRHEEDYKCSPKNIKLPYDGVQKNDIIIFDTENLPDSLCVILHKFIQTNCN